MNKNISVFYGKFDLDFVEHNPFIKRVLKTIIISEQATASMIQSKFDIGYSKASEIIDLLEEKGFIGPYDGSRPRDIYFTAEKYRGAFYEDPYDEEEDIQKSNAISFLGRDIDLIKEILRLFIRAGRATYSMILWEFDISLDLGMKLMDYFERQNFIGPEKSNRDHDVYITRALFKKLFHEVDNEKKIDDDMFHNIVDGRITVDLRPDSDDLSVGDCIEFVSSNKKRIKAKITRLISASCFSDFSHELLYNAGVVENDMEFINEYMEEIYPEQIQGNGALAVEFKVVKEND